MKNTLYLLVLSILFVLCFKKNKSTKTDLKEENNVFVSSKKEKDKTEQKYFNNVKEFKKFVSRKWISLEGEVSCLESRTIEIDGNNFQEYTGMEPSSCKILDIKKIDEKIIEITIEDDCNYGNKFKVEILNLKEKLVKWYLYNGISYEAKPYSDLCNNNVVKTSSVKSYKENSFTKKWEGFYQFSNAEENEDWREGKNYDLYVSLDSVNLKSYGYQHVKNRESYALQEGDSLFIYGQDEGEGLLLKLFVKNNEYVVSSLLDRKGEFKILKKTNN